MGQGSFLPRAVLPGNVADSPLLSGLCTTQSLVLSPHGRCVGADCVQSCEKGAQAVGTASAQVLR